MERQLEDVWGFLTYQDAAIVYCYRKSNPS